MLLALFMLFYCCFFQDCNDPVSSPRPLQNSANESNVMTPVINMLNQWETEALPEEDGVNLLAVSHRNLTYICPPSSFAL